MSIKREYMFKVFSIGFVYLIMVLLVLGCSFYFLGVGVVNFKGEFFCFVNGL